MNSFTTKNNKSKLTTALKNNFNPDRFLDENPNRKMVLVTTDPANRGLARILKGVSFAILAAACLKPEVRDVLTNVKSSGFPLLTAFIAAPYIGGAVLASMSTKVHRNATELEKCGAKVKHFLSPRNF